MQLKKDSQIYMNLRVTWEAFLPRRYQNLPHGKANFADLRKSPGDGV
jgi:hypothetical protein